ncbi:MAG: VOC family protein, partial [Chloroflexi bacterium]|nr:VOC family protein [Chloroflexota bacterium]
MTSQVSRMSHWAICVRNMEASLGFYRDLLGFRVILDRMQDTTE